VTAAASGNVHKSLIFIWRNWISVVWHEITETESVRGLCMVTM
jgi:hypothetical protein